MLQVLVLENRSDAASRADNHFSTEASPLTVGTMHSLAYGRSSGAGKRSTVESPSSPLSPLARIPDLGSHPIPDPETVCLTQAPTAPYR